jgi:hypothetical protein
MSMSFDYDISKAIDIELDKDESNNPIIRLEFRYVTFKLKLDDKIKTQRLLEMLTGTVIPKKKAKKEVTLPKMYKSER